MPGCRACRRARSAVARARACRKHPQRHRHAVHLQLAQRAAERGSRELQLLRQIGVAMAQRETGLAGDSVEDLINGGINDQINDQNLISGERSKTGQ